MKNFILKMILGALGLLSCLQIEASVEQISGIYYEVYSDYAVVTSGKNKYTGDIVIPQYINGTIKVTEISVRAFFDCKELVTVSLPNTITTIGIEAFLGCRSLTSVNIPTNITEIAYGTFSGCSGLTAITIPNSVTSIGSETFRDCSGLTAVNIPNSVTSIGERAFYNCSGLNSIIIPNSVKSIGDSAFGNCDSLTSVDIPNSVQSIGNFAFSGCDGLTTISIPNGITYISLAAFMGCRNLSSITIPNSVTSIVSDAFEGCSNLTSLTIGSGVVHIGFDAFGRCSSLASIKVDEGNSVFDSRGGCNAIIETSSNTLIVGCQNTTIPSSVTSIGSNAFCDCSSLTSITIPSRVTSIGGNAFYRCSGLNSVVSEVEKPFQFDLSAFDNIASTCTLTVPFGTKEAYIAKGWTEDVFKGGIFTPQLVITFPTNSEILEFGVNPSLQLTPNISISGIKRNQLTWVSSDNDIASVSGDGLVTGKKHGTITITCSYQEPGEELASASCTIVVRNRIVNNIEFVPSTQVLEYSKQTTLQLNPVVAPEDISNNHLVWTSSDENIATVSNTGIVTAKKLGTVTITCKGETETEEGVSASCTVMVTNRIVENIKFVSPTEVLEYETFTNKTMQLEPNITPADVRRNQLTWKSTDESIATVSSDGLVRGQNFGTTTITCSGLNAEGEEVSASCRVIVYKKGLVYVGNIFYDLKETTAHVTNCAGGQPSNLAKEREEYSGTVNIPEKVTYDGVTYPVTAVGDYAFYNQKDLQAVVIPKSVLTLNSSSFEKSKNLARVAFMNRDEALRSVGERAFYECEKLNNVVLPNSVQRIDHSAFRYCTSLNKITLSNSLNYINEYAFADCSALDNVNLPESLKSIQIAAFNNDVAMSSITFPAGLEGIGASAFANCTTLQGVAFNINHYNMTIGEDAFKGSNAISKVNVAHLDSWVSINFSNPNANPASISNKLYDDNEREIIDAVVPEGPIYVNNNVFYGCQSLKSVVLPSTIQFINDNIFYGCSALERVVSQAEIPPMFIGTDDPLKMNAVFEQADLYVLAESVSDYQSDDWWKRFGNAQIYTIPSTLIDAIEDGIADDGTHQIYTVDGKPVEALQKGLNIIKYQNGTTKKVLVK